jgi:hypothetical protein
MGDEALGAARDPGEIADAQLPTLPERRQRQPRRVRERPRPPRRPEGRLLVEQPLPDGLGPRGIETE